MYDMMEPVLVTNREYAWARKRRAAMLEYVSTKVGSKEKVGFTVWVDFDGGPELGLPRKVARTIALCSIPITSPVDGDLHVITVRVDIKSGQYVVLTRSDRGPTHTMLDTPQQVIAYVAMAVSTGVASRSRAGTSGRRQSSPTVTSYGRTPKRRSTKWST